MYYFYITAEILMPAQCQQRQFEVFFMQSEWLVDKMGSKSEFQLFLH